MEPTIYPTRDAARTRAFLDAMHEYGRNYRLPVTFEDTGDRFICHYPPKDPGMLSGGCWSNGRPALSVPYLYQEV